MREFYTQFWKLLGFALFFPLFTTVKHLHNDIFTFLGSRVTQ